MRFRSFQFRVWMAAAALSGWVGIADGASANGRPPGRSIEFSGSESQTVTTNLHQSDKRADTLRQVEQDLRAPLDVFSFTTPADGLQAPFQRYTPRPLSKQAIEQLQRNKNWIMMTPEELLLGTPAAEALKPAGGDAEERARHSRLEEYYVHRSGPKPGLEGGPWRESEEVPWRQQAGSDGTREEGAVPDGVKATEKALRKAVTSGLNDESIGLSSRRDGFSDIFHMGGEKSADQERELVHHKAMMQDMRRAIGAPLDASASDLQTSPPSAGTTAPALGFAGASPSFGIHTGEADKLDPNFGKLRPLLPGAPEKTFGSSSLVPTSAVDTDQRPADRSPPKPTFLAPKRPFM